MSRVLTLTDYRSLIDLQPRPSQHNTNQINYDTVVRQIIHYFTGPSTRYSDLPIEQQRAIIREILTVRDPAANHRYPDDVYEWIDQMLIFERDHRKTLTDAHQLPVQYPALPHIRIWRGDITTLMVDAIVNAGNSGLLGCFQPTHLCIDNVIHAAAGPRLRDDCASIMIKQHRPEPVGHAKITAAYNLPAKYVLHTVGPQLSPQAPVTRQHAQELASCYEACLNLAAEMQNITSVAFCCISTGLFAFPAADACRIALNAVIKWFRQRGTNSHLSLVVFNVFTAEDEQLYSSAIEQISQSS